MQTAKIFWGKGVVKYSDVKESGIALLDFSGFYAVLGGVPISGKREFTEIELLYLGQAYSQSLRKRIPQPHSAYVEVNEWLAKHKNHKPLVMVGILGTGTRKTQQLFDDIECCLIQCNQPICNEQCKDNYREKGRDITIINHGDIYPLKENVTCKKH